MTTSLPRAAALGAATGAAWGVLARIWMRLISTDPEFSWTGTLAIIGLTALLGCGVGTVAASRRAGRSLWWTLAVVPGLLLFLSPGLLVAPCFLVGGLAFARRGRVLTALGWTVNVVTVGVTSVLIARDPEPGADTTTGQFVVFVIGLALMALTLAWAGSHLWRRRSLPLETREFAERSSHQRPSARSEQRSTSTGV